MSIFNFKSKIATIPKECIGLDVKVESSICTGEKTIGFYDPKTKKLLYSELVTSPSDVDNFYKKYDIHHK
ncbi:MAG: hypothetical protein LIO71_07165 [Ruminococcus sp.]|nr:hypothetical protein [Ruminococcus sp.]MCD7799703.1 hypothetical protein [Ruminococcus sp.]